MEIYKNNNINDNERRNLTEYNFLSLSFSSSPSSFSSLFSHSFYFQLLFLYFPWLFLFPSFLTHSLQLRDEYKDKNKMEFLINKSREYPWSHTFHFIQEVAVMWLDVQVKLHKILIFLLITKLLFYVSRSYCYLIKEWHKTDPISNKYSVIHALNCDSSLKFSWTGIRISHHESDLLFQRIPSAHLSRFKILKSLQQSQK